MFGKGERSEWERGKGEEKKMKRGGEERRGKNKRRRRDREFDDWEGVESSERRLSMREHPRSVSSILNITKEIANFYPESFQVLLMWLC